MSLYSVADFGRMIADEGRMIPYVEALRATIKPGDVVVDIGTGTGIFALWACKLGARHVYALDDNPAIDVARRVCKANGYGDRVTFLESLSTDVTLPEKADLVVSDLRGSLPFLRGNLESTYDARERILKPGGILLPSRDTLKLALASAPEGYDKLVGPYERADFAMAAARSGVVNSMHRESPPLVADDLLTEGAAWATVEYGAPPPEVLSGRASLEVLRSGVAHGWSIWFDAVIFGDLGFSNAPGTSLVYGRMFAPLEQPLTVAQGDRIEVSIFGRAVGGSEWIWGWVTTHVPSTGGPRREVRQAATAHIVRPSDDERGVMLRPLGRIARRALELMDVESPRPPTLAVIVAQLVQEFGAMDLGTSRFGVDKARELVRDLGHQFGRKMA